MGLSSSGAYGGLCSTLFDQNQPKKPKNNAIIPSGSDHGVNINPMNMAPVIRLTMNGMIDGPCTEYLWSGTASWIDVEITSRLFTCRPVTTGAFSVRSQIA